MLELYGRGVSNGIAIGKLSFYSNEKDDIPKYTVKDADAELKRYRQAASQAKQHLQQLYDEAYLVQMYDEGHTYVISNSITVDGVIENPAYATAVPYYNIHKVS